MGWINLDLVSKGYCKNFIVFSGSKEDNWNKCINRLSQLKQKAVFKTSEGTMPCGWYIEEDLVRGEILNVLDVIYEDFTTIDVQVYCIAKIVAFIKMVGLPIDDFFNSCVNKYCVYNIKGYCWKRADNLGYNTLDCNESKRFDIVEFELEMNKKIKELLLYADVNTKVAILNTLKKRG